MTGITATETRSNLYRLIDEIAESHQMGMIGKHIISSMQRPCSRKMSALIGRCTPIRWRLI